MTERPRSVLIKILLRHLYRTPSGVSRRQRRAMGRAEPKYHANRGRGWGRVCTRRHGAGAGPPPCGCTRRRANGSEVNGNISPFSGLRGRDIELLTQPRITHEQITASNNPPAKSSARTLSISILGEWGGGGSTRRKDLGCEWARARAQETCLRPPGMPRFHFTEHEHPCQRPAGRALRGWRGRGPRLTAGALRPAVRVYSLQGRAAEYSSFRWMIK